MFQGMVEKRHILCILTARNPGIMHTKCILYYIWSGVSERTLEFTFIKSNKKFIL